MNYTRVRNQQKVKSPQKKRESALKVHGTRKPTTFKSASTSPRY